MNKKVSVLVLERDTQRINYFDLNFKNRVLNYKVVKNMQDFYDTLLPRPWDFIFVENDLAPEALAANDPRSGYNALVVFNEQLAPELKEFNQGIIVHTANTIAQNNMQEYAYINNIPKVKFLPFNTSEFKGEIVKIQKYISDTELNQY